MTWLGGGASRTTGGRAGGGIGVRVAWEGKRMGQRSSPGEEERYRRFVVDNGRNLGTAVATVHVD